MTVLQMIPNPPDRRKPSGCLNAVWTIFWIGALIATLFFSLFVLEPLTIELLKPAFCEGKIERRSGTRRPSLYCVDKRTGKETNISHIQLFSQCPCAFLMVLLVAAALFSGYVVNKIERRG